MPRITCGRTWKENILGAIQSRKKPVTFLTLSWSWLQASLRVWQEGIPGSHRHTRIPFTFTSASPTSIECLTETLGPGRAPGDVYLQRQFSKFYEVKHTFKIQLNNFTPKYLPKINEYLYSHNILYINLWGVLFSLSIYIFNFSNTLDVQYYISYRCTTP